jgi:putative tryptophan/tyrosine transport system substrate-binding protein
VNIGRRTFISLLGGAVIAAPRPTRGQDLPIIGLLHAGRAERYVANAAGFARGLREAGFAEAQNLAIAYHFANGQPDELPGLAADLVDRKVALIICGDARAAMAARSATSSIPLVFVLGDDPVWLGLVGSIERPGGNATGATYTTAGLMSRKLMLLRDLLPRAARVGYLGQAAPANGANIEMARGAEAHTREIQAAAGRLGWQVVVAEIDSDRGYESAFTTFTDRKVDALVLAPSRLFEDDADDIVNLAVIHEIPTIYPARADVVAGGLMSYGARQPDAWQIAGRYAGQILNGANPAEMPVVHAPRVEFVISRTMAKAFDLPLSPALLGLADEVLD